MHVYIAELHVHTVLSPCAEVEMIPPLIVHEALERGITLIAITDHNASANVSAVRKAAQGTPLVVLPGMELQTLEEVHLLCLFDSLEQLQEWQNIVDRALPPLRNRPDFFGEQYVVDENGQLISQEDRLLIVSTSLSIEEACDHVFRLGGIAIPAHIDRKAFGLIANLGFVPENLPIDAVEISRFVEPSRALVLYPQIFEYPLIQSGDVHRLDEFLGANEFFIEEPTISEMRKALRQAEGRRHKLIHRQTFLRT